ncbi:MAG TPA: reverse transcriptase family protein, partial [Usitatibacter sp.]|nr:reverse transcriptase family protein [Usitatibacter sp.]
KRLAVPHLPQGAPTSPALANLCALHLDMRIAGLSEELGARYTRYADDLALSGGEGLRRRVHAVTGLVTVIAAEEGFEVNARKTRVMHRGDRQALTGIVVNDKPNIRRDEYDRLKAILTNCERHGAASQNRGNVVDFRAHLAGRVAYVRSLNAARGEKLEGILRRIAW